MKAFFKKIIPTPIWTILRDIKWTLKGYIEQIMIRVRLLLHLPLKQKKNLLGFRIRVAEHCNLNCKGCDNFSPLAEPEFVELDELRHDLSRLGKLFNHKCNYIYLTGGEALLHPELTSIMKMAREEFTDGDIYLFSNGILLSQQTDNFWNTCRENKINIICTAYPININIDAIRAKADAFGVEFQWAWGEKEHGTEQFVIKPINLKGNSDIRENFAKCYRANNCVYLSHGRMYTCSFAVTVRHFNKYFNENVAITDADSINIYDDDITADEIFNRLAKPIPMCRYCKTERKVIDWGISKREISEWI